MGKRLNISQDEHGYFTLQLPQPTSLENALPRWLRTPVILQKLHLTGKKRLLLYLALGASSLWLVSTLLFFVPSGLSYSVSGDACAFNPTLFPRLNKHVSSPSFALEPRTGLSVAGYPIFTLQTCINPVAAPVAGQQETAKVSLLHIPFLNKNISVTPAALPLLSASFEPDSISTADILAFEMSQIDGIFAYKVHVDDKTNDCFAQNSLQLCNLIPLHLSPGTEYTLSLHRYFDNQPKEEVLSMAIKTLDPVIITSTSIGEGTTVYDAPGAVAVEVNKPIYNVSDVILKRDDGEPTASVSASFEGKKGIVTFSEPLARSTSYTLVFTQLTAQDGSVLVKPHELHFTMSGGPKVAASSIGSSRVQPWSSITLTFDVGLKPGQNLGALARVELAGQAVAASVTASANRLIINPHADLPRCTPFKVVLNAGLVNEHGIGDGEAWSINSRTICQVAFSIGSSVQGRSITAYRFGSGASRIVFVGGMHGNEKSSTATLNAFISYLEDHSGEIPAHRSIVIIPVTNPDGYARNWRTNINGVDLNRNWPASDWQPSVQMPGGVTAPTGGGNSPADQPETQAVMNYINANSPRLVLTYHAVASVVISNDIGDSAALGQQYASQSGYRFTTDAGSDSEFGYSTTGEFEDWLADIKGKPALLVELSSMSASQFTRQRAAMMHLVKLP